MDARASTALDPVVLHRSVESDPIGAVTGAIQADVNILSQFESMKAMTLLKSPAPDPGEVWERTLNLLYGKSDLVDRSA